MENKINYHQCSKCNTKYNSLTFLEKYKKNKCPMCLNMYINIRNAELKKQDKIYCIDCKESKKKIDFYDNQLNFYMDHCLLCKQKCKDEMIYLFD